MHRILNYGSTLQAYSLRRILEGLDDAVTVSFVDYHPGPTLIPTTEKGSRLGRNLVKVKEYASLDARLMDRARFLNHKRGYSAKYLPIIGMPAEMNYDTKIDLLVIGSDEVFNCVQANTNVGFSPDLFGETSKARQLISYAASFGNTTIDKIDAYGIRSTIREGLSKFDSISVRDSNSAEIVQEVTSRRPEIHVDPVLAYGRLLSEGTVPSRRMHPRPYVIAYGYPGRFSPDENLGTRSYAKSIGAEVLCFGGTQGCGDRFIDCSPFELLAYFRDAEAVVTDTFHGTIFSIINGTRFATLVRSTVDHGYGNEQKLSDLLDTFNLQGRRVASSEGISEILSSEVDADSVSQILSRERFRARDYLRKHLGSREE